MTMLTRRVVRLIACAAVIVLSATGVPAQSDAISVDRVALAAGRAGKWDVAGRQWSEAATLLAASATSASELRSAARSYVLAAAAFERATDAQAYAAWSDGVRLFLQSGTTWPQERARLKSHVDDIQTALLQPPSGPGFASAVSALDVLQLDLDRELRFTTFDGPRPGLASIQTTAPVLPSESTGDPQFLPRLPVPLGASASIPDGDDAGLLRRGVVPEEPRSVADLTWLFAALPWIDLPSAPAPMVRSPAVAESAAPVPSLTALHLSAEDRELATSAWAYLERNLQTKTGLVSAVAGYPRATMWDVGSALAAAASAEQLGIVDRPKFLEIAGRLIDRLATLPLYNDELPNREYDIANGAMLDSRGRVSATGSGWSALDVGRLLTWLQITRSWYPQLSANVDRAVSRWRFTRLVKDGELYGVLREDDVESVRQEGRLGYEQYAAAGFALWGQTAWRASGYAHRTFATVEGIRVPRDTRTHAFLTSEPFMLATIELGGISPDFSTMTRAIYDVQRRRSASTGALVAVSEDSLNREPWFVYNTIFYDAVAWDCVSPGGRSQPGARSMSTKAAIGWNAIYGDAYSATLATSARGLSTPAGVQAGRYDLGGSNTVLNINTNAVVLEALLYTAREKRPFISADAHEVRR